MPHLREERNIRMNTKTDAEVIINGKRYNLSGFESEEYLQKVASYLNCKYSELKELKNYRNMDVDMRTVLMQINLADDYFKIKKQLVDVTDELQTKDEEVYGLKHDLLAINKKLAEAEEQLEQMKGRWVDEQKKVASLSQEIKDMRERRR